jgi:PAS domain-containing protein
MSANIPGCVYRGVVHPDGRTKLLYISEGEDELSGLSAKAAMAELERLLGTLPPDSQADFYEALKASAQSHKPVTQEYPIASPNGEVKWVRNSARYSLMDNGDVMVDGVAIDISDCLRNSFASGTKAAERVQLLENAIAEGTTSLQVASHDTLPIKDST